jgi:hypothetical protein
VAFSSDSRTLYIGHEQELYASVIEVGAWRGNARLEIGRAQHDLSISPDARGAVGHGDQPVLRP